MVKLVQFVFSTLIFLGIVYVHNGEKPSNALVVLLIVAAAFAMFNLFSLYEFLVEDESLIREIEVGEAFKVLSLFEEGRKTYIFYRLESDERTHLTEVSGTFEICATYVLTKKGEYIKKATS